MLRNPSPPLESSLNASEKTPGESLSRRDFLLAGAATAGSLALPQAWAQGGAAAPPGPRKVLHIIGHSHIDPAWLWPWRDGADAALNTFRSALDRMNETPGFRFSHSSAAQYRWVQRADPAMFEEVRQRVREGRWEVVGGWPVEADCNVPSSESFMRHALYGKAYFRHAFDVDVTVGFSPDTFGHAAGLPTLLQHTGFKYYVFSRPVPSDNPKLPLLFWWEGPDGSRVLTLKIPGSYSATPAQIPRAVRSIFPPGFDHGAFFLGVGDHGGAVTREQIKQLLALRADPNLPELRWSTLREFFQAVEQSPALATLPVIPHELQHVARGCYSSVGEVKQLNRRAERTLGQAECIAHIAHASAGHPYRSPEYAEAWWNVAFNQFHDLLPGTALRFAYQDLRDSVGAACHTATASKVEALQRMARRVNTRDVKESAIFLFNPLPWKRTALVEIQALYDPAKNKEWISHLKTKEGTRIPLQFTDDLTPRAPMGRLTALVELPACGYRVVEVAHGPPPASAGFRDNISVTKDGFGLSSLRAEDGTELLAAPLGLVVIEDLSSAFGHGVTEFYLSRFRREIGRPTFVSSVVIDDGPVLRRTRQRARWQSSEIVMDIVQYAGSDAVELSFAIDWCERRQILKLELPTALREPGIFAKVPGAVAHRGVNGEEEPCQDWLTVQGRVGATDYSLGLINNSTYSYDCLDGLLRTVLIRSAPFVNATSVTGKPSITLPPNTNTAWMDQGRQEKKFWLVAGRGTWSTLAMDRRADDCQTPAEYVWDSAHHGSEPWESSFLEVGPNTVSVLAIKQSENGSETVVRLQERSGASNVARLVCPPLGIRSEVALAPFEIKTLRLSKRPGGRSEIAAISPLETV